MAIGALALALAGCAPGGGIPAAGGFVASTTTSPPVREAGAPVVVGLGGVGSPRTLNPLLDGPDATALDAIGDAVFASAYAVDATSRELVPQALLEIPSVANGGVVDRGDGTVAVTYRVSPTARWSDGEALTAEDLRFTYEVVSDPSLPIRRDIRAHYRWVVRGSASADGLTLRLVMRRGGDPGRLFGVILPAHQVAGTDFVNDWNDRMWVAGGPFAFAAWQPGQYLQLRRNPHYAPRDPADGSSLPHLDEVVYRFFPEPDGAALEEAFAARLIDVAVLSSGADFDAYAALADRGAVVDTAPGLTWEALLFQLGPANRNGESLNRERRFREAVARAVDREQLGRARGTEAPSSIYAGCRPGLASGAWDDLSADPGRVEGFLGELGNDLGVDLFAGDGPRVMVAAAAGDAPAVATAEAVTGMLRAAGIGAEVQVEEAASFYGATLREGTWDVAVLTLSCGPGLGAAMDLARLFDPAAPAAEGADPARWGAPGAVPAGDTAAAEYSRLMAQLDRTADERTAESLLRRAEGILAGEVLLLPLAVAGRVGVAYWADGLQGVRVSPTGGVAAGIALWDRVG